MVFNYFRKIKDDVIPGTYGRFTIDRQGVVYDKLHQKIVEPHGKGYNLHLTWYPNPVPVEKLIAVTFKGWHAPLEMVQQCEILYADNNPENLHPGNLIWRFPKNGLHVPNWPGYYFIPSFTRYGINRENKVISLFEGVAKVTNLGTTGYRDLGLRRDCGAYVGTHLHRAVALTFIPYGNDINWLVVNHKDGDRDNTELDNLEWATQQENVLHGKAMSIGYSGSAKNSAILTMLKNRGVNVDGIELDHDGVEVKDIVTGEVFEFTSQLLASKGIGVSPGTISLKLSGTAIYPVILDRFIVRRVGHPWPTWDETVEYSQAKAKTTLVKCVATGDITEYASAKEAYLKLGLSKKVVMTRLRGKDKRPVNGYVFKYATDETGWE